jgi:enoyl-[acyl-carrier-protein] reductase (NADH)
VSPSGLLRGKTALVVGVASERSLAWAIAQALAREGAELAFSYQGERLGDRNKKNHKKEKRKKKRIKKKRVKIKIK